MRLIDTDYLLKNGYRVCKVGNGVFGLNNVIDEIPTAYDVDKIIGQLEREKAQKMLAANDYESVGNFKLAEIYSQLASEYNTAIKIVKAGGTDETN